MSSSELAIGIDFGGTSVKTGVVYGDSVIDSAPPIATQDFEGPEPLLDALVRTIEDLRNRHPSIAAVGIGVPGFVNFEYGIVANLTNVPGWQNYRLKSMLEQRVDLPITVDNDANCMAYAEWKRGSGLGINDLIAITLGTGVGGGVVTNGQLVRGCQYGAGEVGQMSIDWQGTSGHYGNLGALEEYIGNQQISARAIELYRKVDISKGINDVTPALLSKAAHAGDEIALQLWDEVARRLACALMNCCWLLNPRAIIIGGGVARAGEVLFQPLTNHLFSQLSGPFKDHLMIVPAKFGNEAGIIGASTLALDCAGLEIAN